jgi:hypothetical protein
MRHQGHTLHPCTRTRAAPQPDRRARRDRRGRASERGMALVAAILILALLATVGAATLWLVRSELWVAGSARSFLQARYSAEAGAWHALGALAPGTDFASLLASTGGLADPARPGPLPFPGGGFTTFPGPPFGYAVTVHALATERVRLRSTATAVRGARRVVDATVGREVAPYAPAALVVISGAVAVAAELSGLDPDAGGIGVDARLPADGAQAIVGGGSSDAAGSAWSSLDASSPALQGTTPRVRVRAFDVAEFAATSGLAEESPAALAVPRGASGAPVALRIGAGVAPSLVGHGVVLVPGDLEIEGTVDWHGVLYVAGELRLRAGACRIDGLVWARAVSFATGCLLRFDPAAVAAADSVLRLPRRPTLLALDDA